MGRRLRSTRTGIGGLAPLLALLAAASLALGSTEAAGRVVVPDDELPADIQLLLGQLRRAFETGDHGKLVSYLHPDGVTIDLGPQTDRARLMTPAQAHYYFKNLFQLRRTQRFAYLKQHAGGPRRAHAVAVWHWERSDSGRANSERLMLTLVRSGDDWRVTEITALRRG